MKDHADADLAISVISALASSLREFYMKNKQPKVAEVSVERYEHDTHMHTRWPLWIDCHMPPDDIAYIALASSLGEFYMKNKQPKVAEVSVERYEHDTHMHAHWPLWVDCQMTSHEEQAA